jgi:exosortase
MDSPEGSAAVVVAQARPRPKRLVVRWADLIGAVGWWKIAILSALIALIYRQELGRMFFIWTHNGDWSHGLLVPVYSLYFLHSRRHKLLGAEPRGSYAGLFIVGLAVVLFLLSVFPPYIGYARTFSIVVMIFGVVLLVGGTRALRVAWFPIFFLLFAVPFPEHLMFRLTLPMRQIASHVAAFVLQILTRSPAEADGVNILAVYHGELFRLNVERACAGMRLMMAFLALGTAITFLSERPIWHRIVMLLSCLPIALFCNIVRVTTTSIIHVFVGKEYASGSAHTLLGLSMLLVAFGLFFAISYVLNNLFVEIPEGEPGPPPTGPVGACG